MPDRNAKFFAERPCFDHFPLLFHSPINYIRHNRPMWMRQQRFNPFIKSINVKSQATGFCTKCPVVQHQRLPQAQAPLQIVWSGIGHTEMLAAHCFQGFDGRYGRSMIVNHWCALSCIRLVASFVRQISISSLAASISQRSVSSWAIAAASPFSKV